MPRVAVPVTPLSRTGTGVAPATETNGDSTNNHTVPNDGRTFLLVRNANASSTARVLTVRLSGGRDGQSITPKTYSIAAGASRYIGPFPVSDYGSTMQLDVDNAELKLSAYRLP